MAVIGYFFQAIAFVLGVVLELYFYIVIVSALLSWVNPDPYNPIVRTLRKLTEPVFYRIRRWFPFVFVGGIDFSPVVVIMIVYFLKIFLVQTLSFFAMTFR